MTRHLHSGQWQTTSPEQTFALGETLGRLLSGSAIVALVGALGAGKTQFVKGIASGNGVANSRQVTSPTFTLVQEYAGRLTLYHCDAYRLSSAKEFDLLGIEELIRPGAAVVIEWADRVAAWVPPDALWIELEHIDSSTRKITARSTGPVAAMCLSALQDAYC